MINTYLFSILGKRQWREVQPVSWDRLQQNWRLSAEDLISIKPFLIAALILAVCLGAIWMWKAGQVRRGRSMPVRVFNQVVQGLGLTRADRWLLIRIAHHLALPSPLTLVLSDTTFGHYLDQYTQTIDAKRRAKIQNRAARIRRVLFGVTRG